MFFFLIYILVNVNKRHTQPVNFDPRSIIYKNFVKDHKILLQTLDLITLLVLRRFYFLNIFSATLTELCSRLEISINFLEGSPT
jgi:hypothetical protein